LNIEQIAVLFLNEQEGWQQDLENAKYLERKLGWISRKTEK